MKYALIYSYDPVETGPGGEAEVEEWVAFGKAVEDAGQLVHEAGFHESTEGKSVRVRDGRVTVEDGTPAGEAVAGYFVLDVPDENAAISWAQRIPTAGYGRVDVRQVTEF